MEEILALFAGGGLGTAVSAITGLVGGYLTKKENRLLKEQENSHEVTMAKLDQESERYQLEASLKMAEADRIMARTEAEMAMEVASAEASAEVSKIDAKGFALAMAEAQKPTGYPFVDKVRSLMRPVLTTSTYVFIVVIFGFLQWKVGELVAKDTELLTGLYEYLIRSIIYLFIMMVSWWFMSRGDNSVQQIKNLKKDY